MGGARGGDETDTEALPHEPPAGWVGHVAFPPGLERPTARREVDIVAAIEDVVSDDFGHRTRGSRALLAFGEPAVPYLGERATAAGAVPDPDSPYCILIQAILGKLPASRVRYHIESPYPIVRIAAASAAGDRGYEELAPVLAARLDDPELEVRRAAVTALRRITREFLGYRASDRESDRAEAAEAWRRETGAAPR